MIPPYIRLDILADEILFGRLRQGGMVRIERPEDCAPAADQTLNTENLCFLITETSPSRASLVVSEQ